MTTAPRHSGIRRFVVASIASLAVVFTVTVVLCIVYIDDLVRIRYMGLICSEDDEQQARGVSYLITHADDPDVIAAADAMLPDADDRCFDALVHGLTVAGVWGPNFEAGWVRYLTRQVDQPDPDRRTHLAVELGKLLWKRGPHSDDPRLVGVIRELLGDDEAQVRLNALSAAAALPTGQRVELIRIVAGDDEPEIAKHAWIMLRLLGEGEGVARPTNIPEAFFDERPAAPPDDAADVVHQLAWLEKIGVAAVPMPELTDDTPDLIRLHAVRVGEDAKPDDLMRVFNADAPEMRDLACVTAILRFTPEQNRELAKELILRFTNAYRTSGAILAGLLPTEALDDRLLELLRLRADSGDDWIVQQHYKLALAMHGLADDGFRPQSLMGRRDIPKTTMILALAHSGDLAGFDWLLNPFAEPPVDLLLVFDAMRYWPVVRRYLPDAPEFSYWATAPVQRTEVEALRDWYLLNRPSLEFNETKRQFTTEGTEDTESKNN